MNFGEVNFFVIFIEVGIFEVSLCEGSGGDLVGIVIIIVFDCLDLSFMVDIIVGCVFLVLSFVNIFIVDLGIGIMGYSWVFGDGGLVGGVNLNYIYSGAGIYDVLLSIIID